MQSPRAAQVSKNWCAVFCNLVKLTGRQWEPTGKSVILRLLYVCPLVVRLFVIVVIPVQCQIPRAFGFVVLELREQSLVRQIQRM